MNILSNKTEFKLNFEFIFQTGVVIKKSDNFVKLDFWKKYIPRIVLFQWKLVMDRNQFLFIETNKMFLMIIDKGRNTIINTNWKE